MADIHTLSVAIAFLAGGTIGFLYAVWVLGGGKKQ